MRLVAILLLAICGHASAAAPPKPILLSWAELLPEGELERLEAMQSMLDSAVQPHSFGGVEGAGVQVGTFNTVSELDGKLVRIPGFVLPFEYSKSGKISEFLLVPYFGACIHVPPPPPNQMVYVKAPGPVDVGNVWAAVYVVGVLRAKPHRHEIADAAYSLELQSWEPYEE